MARLEPPEPAGAFANDMRRLTTDPSNPSPTRVLAAIGFGTALSLIGDSSLYAVLPTHTQEAGVTLASVGILLSANRFIRLFLNGPAGVAYSILPRRWLFLPALYIGAISTGIYAFSSSFWPLLVGRLLWGLAWAGIWVGGNTIILDISSKATRGRWVGLYQISFYLGAASGAFVGGYLTDRLGYSNALGIEALLTLLGAVLATLLLPETRGAQTTVEAGEPESKSPKIAPKAGRIPELLSATALQGVNRLVLPGLLSSTFGLFLLTQLGDPIRIFDRSVGVATATGLGMGFATLISMATSPLIGSIADKHPFRWRMIAAGLVPGVAGFLLLSRGSPAFIMLGLPLAAIAGASNQSLSTVVIGDWGSGGRHGRQLGLMFTVGDLASAIGPPLAYGLIPFVDIGGVYILSAALFAGMLLVASLHILRARKITAGLRES